MEKVIKLVLRLGKYYFANGRVYDGDWENNLRSGNGIKIKSNLAGKVYKNNELIYEGTWKNNKAYGKGKFYSEFSKGLRYKKGIAKEVNNCRYLLIMCRLL